MKIMLLAGVCALAVSSPAWPQASGPQQPTLSQVVVTAKRSVADANQLPQTTSSSTADQVELTTNVTTVEDELKYLPDVLIRERHIGDTQDPITTRTSGVGSSARSLVYEDGVLVSALIGNNNTNASPRWDLVSPDEVERTDVLYGPFSAAYPGESIGEVVQITTRMPARFEASGTIEGAAQAFGQYGMDRAFPTGRISATVGDELGKLSFWLSAFHLDTESQPLYDVTATTPASPSAAGTPVTGAFPALNRTGQPIQVLGAGGLEHQVEDSVNLKLSYDFTSSVTGIYSAGLYRQVDNARVQTYLRDAAGAPVYGDSLNIGGYDYAVAASAFDTDLYRLEEGHLAQSLALRSRTGGTFDWELAASDYAYLTDQQRNPATALPAAFEGGPGTITSLKNSGWYTLDARGWWRPQGPNGLNQVSFGVHDDEVTLDSPKYNTADWTLGPEATTASVAKGRTETTAAWIQDLITVSPFTLTLGGRYEHWRAFDGINASLSPPLDVQQPRLSADAFSPKAVLAFTPSSAWRFSASIGQAYRFPTVEELYQAVATGNQISIPDPDLQPERALSEELSAQRSWMSLDGRDARLRLSLFQEDVSEALISQSAPLVPGSSTLYSYVQNVGHTRVRGAELVAGEQDAVVRGLSLSAWITYVNSDITSDSAFPAAVGKQLPQLPRLRAGAVETWQVAPRLIVTIAERYSDRSYGTINNVDLLADTFTGFSSYFVVDVHAAWQLSPHLTADFGVDNLNDDKYFLYHPFPQRTVVAALKFRY